MRRIREAEHEVDEFLRKFFNARMQVQRLLPDDMQRFTAAQFERFFETHDLLGEGDVDVTSDETNSLPARSRTKEEVREGLSL